MGKGKHRAISRSRYKVPSSAVLSVVPVALILTATGTVNAQPAGGSALSQSDQGQGEELQPDRNQGDRSSSGQPEQWPAAVAPNVHPYQGLQIPDDTLSSLQWARPIPDKKYLAPLGPLNAPVPVAPVPPIAPAPGTLRFGDLQVDSPEWLDREQAIQLNDGAAEAEAGLATFLDSIGMERSRSDRVAGETIAGAATGATAGAVAASPFGLIGGVTGGALAAAIGLPFAPIGLVAVPIGAAYGAALMEVPIAAIGAGVGAIVGSVHALSAPPRAVAD
ncbi:hypothetical protein [Nocardia stercoris]|uniref:Uncharacterized protein n=1 Tax=Nocardia stercoris TaxID=2483361 RepID=A0A3M2L7M4_9NOCA|nr:hypothetical protein [Nocardia stercoris]RMI33629.1 hypothetical protein EBN03_11070 [Nocardia stercoris]